MDLGFFNFIEKNTPKLNPIIANGVASSVSHTFEEIIEKTFRYTSKGYPPGLEYLGYSRCDPEEEFNEKSKKRTTHREYDFAHSDVYMLKHFFKFKDEEFFIYQYVPFIDEANTLMIGGARYLDSPVVFDKPITPDSDNIFTRVRRGKFKFMVEGTKIIVNGKLTPFEVVYGLIYNKNSKQRLIKSTISAQSAVGHYLFCKYGFDETILRYTGKKVIVKESTEKDYDPTHYPVEEYTIYESSRPPKRKLVRHPRTSDIVVIVKNEDITNVLENIIASFFYVVDLFPERVHPKYINDTRFWKILLGNIILSGSINAGKLYEDMNTHINTLDEFIDEGDKQSFKQIGIVVNDFYDLMAEIMNSYSLRILKEADKINSYYEKKLEVPYYLLYPITESIVCMYFKLTKLRNEEKLDMKNIRIIFQEHMKVGIWFNVRRTNGELSTQSYCGDNKVLKFTTVLTPQRKVRKGGSDKSWAQNDPAKSLDTSVALLCHATTMSKEEPDGRNKLNPYAHLDKNLVMLPQPHIEKLARRVDKMIRKKTDQ